MLPEEVYKTLDNALIPLKCMAVISLTSFILGMAASSASPAKKPLFLLRLLCVQGSIGVVSSLGCLSISALLSVDDHKRLQLLTRPSRTSVDSGYPQVVGQDVGSSLSLAPTPARYSDDLTELFENRYKSSETASEPTSCQSCESYHGQTYGGVKFVCAKHPYGSEGGDCLDYVSLSREYRLVRLQGIGWSNLYFVRIFSGQLLSETFQEAIEVSHLEQKRLIQRFRLKHSTGLPGCVFNSKASTITEAYEELINSCPE